MDLNPINLTSESNLEPSTLAARLDSAWDARWSSQLSSVIRKFPEIRAELGLPLFGAESAEIEKEWKERPRSVQSAIQESDAVLLSASLHRVKGRLNEAERLVQIAQDLLSRVGVSGTFRLHFERGILGYVRGNHLLAVEEFFAASRFTERDLFKLISLTNALLSLENLGLDDGETFEKIENLRGICRSNNPVFLSNEVSLKAYTLRKSFRSGSIAANPEKATDSLGAIDQAIYYSLWVRNLPYNRNFRPLQKSESLELLSSSQVFYQRGFRLRTLLAQTHTEDQDFIKITDRIDRLYIWTWNWLVFPESFHSDRVMATLNDVLSRLNFDELTLEDQYLLRNALGWLALADPALSDQVRPILNKLRAVSGAGYALYDFEWALIQSLNAKKEGKKVVFKDSIKFLKKHPIASCSELRLVEILEVLEGADAVFENPLHALASRILGSTKSGPSKEVRELTVDLNTYVLTESKSGKKIVSQPLSLAIYLLSTRGSVSASDFVREVFGFYQYDSFIHDAKIYNLLARVRGLIPNSIRLRMKQGQVISEGVWERVKVIELAKLASLLRGESVALAVDKRKVEGDLGRKELNVAKLIREFSGKPAFTREQAQATLKTSKSTLNRTLERLVKQRKIKRIGQGKSTRYALAALRTEL